MHPVSVLTFGIFFAGYITARWDLVTRLYELAIFAWDHGVITRLAQGFALISICFAFLAVPVERIASRASGAGGELPGPGLLDPGISAKEQLRRRGSF
ncbi:phosphatidylinositol glycan, class Q [Piedraia hortae CBS 480.64]|uniref:Phosphatidylinositol glycan, class Q n=1 Tax=Piedraia hortae CBS 480.64 TaxID=1314780 RepID=A0A6A7CAZ1_9PEZI|nr:phosphatidylinositol glycan, class Q [Piedraia hortae CBS 480.64]